MSRVWQLNARLHVPHVKGSPLNMRSQALMMVFVMRFRVFFDYPRRLRWIHIVDERIHL
jgi:hypothetical protein